MVPQQPPIDQYQQNKWAHDGLLEEQEVLSWLSSREKKKEQGQIELFRKPTADVRGSTSIYIVTSSAAQHEYFPPSQWVNRN